jgi:hypothetical protein
VTVYATTDDLVARWRALMSDETSKAETLLEDASFWLDQWAPGLSDTTDADALTAAKLLVVAMVRRALIAQAADLPGVQSVSEGWGSYNQAITYRNPEGNLYLYGSELDTLLGILRGNVSAAVSLRSPGL